MLTVIIPTIRYSKGLDRAIESVFKNIVSCRPRVIVAIGSDLERFKGSSYLNNSDVNWHVAEDYRRNSQTGMAMTYHNINSALTLIEEGWILVLADDDEVCMDFNPDEYRDCEAALFSVRILSEDGLELRKPLYFTHGKDIDPTSVLLGFVQSHLSLVVFRKSLISKVGFYNVSYGYPNGYYGDTITNTKLLAHSSSLGFSSLPLTIRYESRTQESSKLYFSDNKRFLWNVVNESFSDEKIAGLLEARQYDVMKLYKKLLYDRLSLEIWKTKSSIFNNKGSIFRLLGTIMTSRLGVIKRVLLIVKLFSGSI